MIAQGGGGGARSAPPRSPASRAIPCSAAYYATRKNFAVVALAQAAARALAERQDHGELLCSPAW